MMRLVIQKSILVVDDESYGVIVHRGDISDCDIEDTLIIKASSWVGVLIHAIAWLGGPYKKR